MRSKFHKTTSECQQRTSGTQKSTSLSLKRVIIHLRRCASCTPRKRNSRDRRGDKSQWLHSPNTWATWTWEGQKTQAQPSLRLWGLPQCLSLSDLDLGGACSPGPASDGSCWSNIEPELCAPWARAGPVWLRHCKHRPVLFVCSVPLSPQWDWTSEPKKVSTTASIVSRWKSDTEETSKQKKLKQREPPWKWQVQ